MSDGDFVYFYFAPGEDNSKVFTWNETQVEATLTVASHVGQCQITPNIPQSSTN